MLLKFFQNLVNNSYSITYVCCRLISEKTIEENILKKANQKRLLGDLAIEGGNFTTAYFKSVRIQSLIEIFLLIFFSSLQFKIYSILMRMKIQRRPECQK